METPRFIGKYEILGRLGAGGMAEVFLARRGGAAGFEKKVALKRLASHQVEDEGLVRSLINEARLVAQLSHQNLVQVLEFEQIDRAYCMAMEYIDGLTLDDVMQRCCDTGVYLPRGLVVFIAREVSAGLDYAHTARTDEGEALNLIHRDIKPSNIMISRQGQVKLMDFGIARATTNAYKTTRSGNVKGTLAYMSPEQLQGTLELTRASDLYSLGVILFEMATLTRLFEDPNIFKLAASMQQGLTGELRDRLAAHFPELVPIVARLLQFEPEERYLTALELMLDLKPLAFQSGAFELSEFLKDIEASGGSALSSGTISLGGEAISALGTGESVRVSPRSSGQVPASTGSRSMAPSSGTEVLPSDGGTPAGPRATGPTPLLQASTGDVADPARMSGTQPVIVQRTSKRVVAAAAIAGAVASQVLLAWWWTSRPEDPSASDPQVAEAPPGAGAGSEGSTSTLAIPAGELAGVHADVPLSAGEGTGGAGVGRLPADLPSALAEPAAASAARTGVEQTGASSGSSSSGSEPITARERRPPAGVPRLTRADPPTAVSAPAAQEGLLLVNSRPYATVYVDGRNVGPTPYKHRIPAGEHRVRLVVGEGGPQQAEKSFSVSVPPDGNVERIWLFEEEKWSD